MEDVASRQLGAVDPLTPSPRQSVAVALGAGMGAVFPFLEDLVLEPPAVPALILVPLPLTVSLTGAGGGAARDRGVGMGYERGHVAGNIQAVEMNMSSCCMTAAVRSSMGRL